MALQIFNADWVGNGVRAELTGAQDMYVMEGVVVGREDAAVAGDYTVTVIGSNNLIKVDGSITGGSGIQLGDDITETNNKVLIGEHGAVQAFLPVPAIHVTGTTARVENSGTIWSVGTGIRLDLASDPGLNTIINHGVISGSSIGITRVTGVQTLEIENYGSITSLTAFNSDGSGVDQFTNRGTINGSILLGGGNDFYDGTGGTLNGHVSGEDGEDLLIGGAGAEIFQGGPQGDTLDGRSGNDRLFGGSHDDILIGGAGNDELYGQGGINTLTGGAGNDIYYVETAADVLTEAANQGIDTVVSASTLTLATNFERLTLDAVSAVNGTGNAVANIITGGGGVNHLRGLAGHDRLLGMDGNDLLRGGVGADRLTGGADADRFIFGSVAESRKANGIDKILDFSRLQKDKFDLKLIDANSTKAGNQAFKFIGQAAFSETAGELRYQKAGSGTRIEADVNGDGKADFTVISDVLTNFVKGDFIL